MNKGAMRASFGSFLVLATVLASCGRKEEISTDVLREESDSFDLRISSKEQAGTFGKEGESFIGFDAQGYESRLLIDFPKFKDLFSESVSDIGLVELRVFCEDLAVNPTNIRLHLISKSWTPFATWTHADGFHKKEAWLKPGSDFNLTPVTPSVRAHSGRLKMLAFDLTSVAKELATQRKSNQGFLLRINKSTDNAKNQLKILTANSSTGQPTSVLVFSRKEDFQK